jgi:Fe-S-cluster-containing dehydrogenase component
MVINTSQCIGCYDCFLTCQDEFCGNTYEGYSAAAPIEGHNWMRVLDVERGQFPLVKAHYTPKTCMHCEDAPCIGAAQNGAVYRRPDGIVVIDPVKARGQKQLVNSCPYRVIEWNETEQLAQKCNLCAHLLDKGEKEPRCVESCPTGAILFGDLDDAKSKVAQLVKSGVTETLKPELALKESVFYIGLPKRFIAGTVVLKDKRECATQAQVEISNEKGSKKAATNDFGDFEFEGLEANQSFTVKISVPGYKAETLSCTTFNDTHLGDIYLSPQA